MVQERLQRRLAAVLMADVVGYSRLMARREVDTLARLKSLRAAVVDPLIAAYGGRLVKEMGDGVLVEYASVVDAVECAVALQRAVLDSGGAIPQEDRISYRIGINLGDIVGEGEDIFGDGVNIAARLQALAEPGGVSISGPVYDQVRNKLDLPYRDLGLQQVKNMAEPVRVYCIGDARPASTVDLTAEEARYRQRVRDRYAEEADYYVPLSGASLPTAEPQQREKRSARRLARRARVEFSELVPAGEEIRLVPVSDLREAVQRHPCVILLGDPGCGKTTALEALAHGYAERPDHLPVLLRLSEFSGSTDLRAFIVQGWGGESAGGNWGAPILAANLDAYLQAGRLLLLLDALNEMPQQGYRERCEALRSFIDNWSARGNRFAVTCRALDYGEELAGLQRIEVQPLTDDQTRHFLQNELPDRWDALWQHLQGDSKDTALLEMARNPYLLTIMIDVFAEDGQLNRNRAQLLRRFTEIMLQEARTKSGPPGWLDANLLVEALSVMAFEMQARSGFGTRVTSDQIKAVMPQRLTLDPNWPAKEVPPDRVLQLAALANIVEMPVDGTTVRFRHQLLQEYFAARRLLRQDGDRLRELCRGPWTEAEVAPWKRPENNYEPLPAPPSSGWEETAVLAAGMAVPDEGFLRAILQIHPVLAARCLLLSDTASGGLRQDVVAALLRGLEEPDVALRVRIAAANALGQLGDPRSGAMVTIPGGAFLMGEGREQHEVTLPAYRIGRYPVTNAEYRRFVEAGGYRERRWWTAAGWMEIARDRQEPRYAQDRRFNLPNQPVIGLSWYECVAYCRWLGAKTGEPWRLPSEAEWEKAARGTDGRLFPWGSSFDHSRLNARGPRDRQVSASTPIGCYPSGVSPYGLHDCLGNVWEWCATRWQKPFPYDSAQDEWTDAYLEGQNLRVLRGGSWYETEAVTRCTHRFRFQPFGWNDRGGFRLVTSASA